MFKDAKVGDRLWSPLGGWGSVDKISESCLSVRFDKAYKLNFFKDGHYSGYSVCPSLFWGEVKIEPPPRPKRKVKKSNTVFLVSRSFGVTAFSSRDIAEASIKDCPAVIPISVYTYEWEEEE